MSKKPTTCKGCKYLVTKVSLEYKGVVLGCSNTAVESRRPASITHGRVSCYEPISSSEGES